MAPALSAHASIELLRRSYLADSRSETASALIALPLVATISILARMLLRKRCRSGLKCDDWVLAVSLPFIWAEWALYFHICHDTIPHSFSTLPDRLLPTILKSLFAESLLYLFGMGLIRIAIIILYFRAFGTTRTKKNILYFLLFVQVAFLIFRFVCQMVKCIPTSAWWNNPGACSHHQELYVGMEIFGLVSELGLLIFPIPIIWSLTALSRGKKLAISFVLLIGTVALAASVWRIRLIAVDLSSSRSLLSGPFLETYLICNLLEMSFGTIAGSLPAIRAPLEEVFVRIKERCIALGICKGKLPRQQSGTSTCSTFESTQVFAANEPKLSLQITTTISDVEKELNSAPVEYCDDGYIVKRLREFPHSA